MSRADLATQFSQDPLRFMDEHFPRDGDVLGTGPGEYSLGDPLAAREVLRNHDGHYREHSDFFHTRYGAFGPRAAQLKIRRGARVLLRGYLQSRDPQALPVFVAEHLAPTSDWPDAGNRLVHRYLAPVLLAPDAPPKLHKLIDAIIERAVLANARARQPRWRRMLLQFDTTFRLSQAIEARQALARERPVDLLDVVASATAPGEKLEELVEVYLSFLFAIAGSTGFALAWALYLLGTHPDRDAPTRWVVQEALRLWPVAWQLGRHPATTHRIGDTEVSTEDEVVVCPYMVHRHPRYWQEPAEFRPERWSDPEAWHNPAFIPFGHGPHRCVAADLSSQFVCALLDVIRQSYALTVEARGTRPTVAAAMSPPPFRLSLRPREEAVAHTRR